LVDEWVACGTMRLIRLPSSLQGMVSRITVPVNIEDLEKFDPTLDKRCAPKFLSNNQFVGDCLSDFERR